MIFKLSKGIDVDILEKSIRSIVNRHEILRTFIKQDNKGIGYQLVVCDKEYPLNIKRIKVGNKKELDEELEREINHIYNLCEEYPIKVQIYKLGKSKGEGEKYISIVIHHIAFDGWSTDIFLKELFEYYKYYLNDRDGRELHLKLPSLSIQYKDFALWQRKYLSGERLSRQLRYWESKLRGYEALNLITDKRRPTEIDYAGKDIYFEINKETSILLRELAKELKVSLYSLLLAGYYLMLKSYSNQDDIVIGSPIANRHYNQIESLIGFFVNTIALRININSSITIKEFIEDVGKEVVEAQLHQDLPFEKLVEELKVAKDTSRHPIFQVMFGVQRFGEGLVKQGSEEISSLVEQYEGNSVYNVAKFDISTFIDDSQ